MQPRQAEALRPSPRSSVSTVISLQAQIAEMMDQFMDERPFALVDFPDHPNVGDSAIWLGELAFFQLFGRSPFYVCGVQNPDWNRLANLPGSPIFIHGGGNFGDIWPICHNFRIEVMRRFPGRLIVQLPQSIHFDHEAAIASTRDAIREHGNFILLVRDRESLEFGRRHFECRVELCPDMAFCLGPQKRRAAPIWDELRLLRTDKEGVLSRPPDGLQTGIPEAGVTKPTIMTSDWLDEPGTLRRRMRLQTYLAHRWKPKNNLEQEYFLALAKHRTERGLRMLSRARHVTTDRLHAHILCTLLGIRHTVLDNSYGKIRRFMGTFGTDWAGVTLGAPDQVLSPLPAGVGQEESL